MSESVISEVQRSTGIIRLNRPQALNALDLSMIQSLHAALDRFASSPSIARVIIESASEKAFCAGGDMRRARLVCHAGNHHRFFPISAAPISCPVWEPGLATIWP